VAETAGIAGKTTVNVHCFLAGNGIAVVTPAKLSVAGQYMSDMRKLTVGNPVIWIRVG
jgi:hypothetical protein